MRKLCLVSFLITASLIAVNLVPRLLNSLHRVVSVQKDLGFPFEVISERRIKGIRDEQQAAIFIDRKYYSKASLDKIFEWY